MSHPIHVKTGDTFEVPLEGSAGTGFRWEVELSPAATQLVKLQADERETVSTVPGGRTLQRFHFRALAPGQVDLNFRYRRTWEAPDSGTLETVSVQIDPAD